MSGPTHYFTAEPEGDDRRRARTVQLAGRTVQVQTAGGIFCPDRLDLGTSVLLRETPGPPPSGELLDLGCGWGPIALTMAMLAPLARVWALDINRRALQLTGENARHLGLNGVHPVTAAQIPEDLSFDAIWSNPPIRVGKGALHDLLLTWLPRLAPGGHAYLVVQRNLGADSLHTWLASSLGPDFVASRLASAKGFRVLHVQRGYPGELALTRGEPT
ncbi:MAG: methyltransferase [Micrococcales bacterium]|nr:methyltransferase [Micrococcales bacterium]